MRLQHPVQKQGKKVVAILGGGFAGLEAAKSLVDHPEVHVILIDQRNHHLFQPLLYQVATGGLNPSDIAVPIRAQFSDADNVEVHMGRVTRVNLLEKYFADENHEIGFDFLVLACGVQHSYFDHPEWEEFAPGLKTIEQATEIRRRVFSAFELAENELNPEKQKSLLSFVVVGGGPTGVEMAGAIADISRTVLVEDFKRIDPASARVVLVEAGPRVLASFSASLSEQARRDLESLGVEVRLSSKVEKINAEGVQIGREFLKAHSVFWGAGVQASSMSIMPDVKKDRAQRVVVEKDFSIAGHPNVFVIGDMASYETSPGVFLPGLAPAAMQAGRFVGAAILDTLQGRSREAFTYLDKGQMATIGKRKAVAEYKAFQLHGFVAWVAWLFIHVLYLVGFKNKVSVFLLWVWSYLFSKRSARLITEKNWRLR